MADESYFVDGYVDFHYYNYVASAESSMEAFDIVVTTARVIHLIQALTYRIREETRLHKIRSETRYYKIKEA